MLRIKYSYKKCFCLSFAVCFAFCIVYYWRYKPSIEYQSRLSQLNRDTNVLQTLNLTCQSPNKPVQDCQPMVQLAHRFPRAIIIGFGKSGTRALLNVLLMHPSIQGPYVEVNYFDQFYRSEGLQWYLESFPPSSDNTINIEKSPQYVITPDALFRLNSVLRMRSLGLPHQSMKFIVIMRDPITRAVSEYMDWSLQRLKEKRETLPSFDYMVRPGHTLPKFIRTSEYDAYISMWLEHFSLDQFCFVDGEVFIADPLRVARRLEVCLGVSRHFRDDHFVINHQKGFFCFNEGDKAHCLKSKGRTHPEISEETREFLNQHFKSHNENLVKLSDQAFTWIK